MADRRTRARPAQPRLIVMPADAGISFNRKTPAFAGVTTRLSPPHGNRYARPSPRPPADRHLRSAVRFGAVGTLHPLPAVDEQRPVAARRAQRVATSTTPPAVARTDDRRAR